MVFQVHPLAQRLKGRGIGRAFNLHEISLGPLVLGMRDAGLQGAVVRQHQKPFAVAIKPPGGIKPLFIDIG